MNKDIRPHIGRLLLSLSFFLCTQLLFANDGAYRASGNHLIPITDHDISVQKEILKITRIDEQYVFVDVYYEFFNAGGEKTVLVGFEAPSPNGDVDATPVNGRHPYIDRFTVYLNNRSLPFKTAIVKDSAYVSNEKIKSVSQADIVKEGFDPNYPEFFYVYHFEANFQEGLNVIKHTYRCQLSSSVGEHYSFEYILTAANRWANNGIDDFTLEVDMGAFQSIRMSHTFFESLQNWRYDGKVQHFLSDYHVGDKSSTVFHTPDGKLIFKKQDFRPKGELYLYSVIDFVESYSMGEPIFDYSVTELPYTLEDSKQYLRSKDETSFKILRNLPYARRGNVFRTPEIDRYYRKMPWYKPDKSYVASLDHLGEEEAAWLKTVRANGAK